MGWIQIDLRVFWKRKVNFSMKSAKILNRGFVTFEPGIRHFLISSLFMEKFIFLLLNDSQIALYAPNKFTIVLDNQNMHFGQIFVKKEIIYNYDRFGTKSVVFEI